MLNTRMPAQRLAAPTPFDLEHLQHDATLAHCLLHAMANIPPAHLRSNLTKLEWVRNEAARMMRNHGYTSR